MNKPHVNKARLEAVRPFLYFLKDVTHVIISHGKLLD